MAVNSKASGPSTPQNSISLPQEFFYLKGKKLGSGSYGKVYQVLRMPDGHIYAAKSFKNSRSFRQEVKMLGKIGKTSHVSKD